MSQTVYRYDREVRNYQKKLRRQREVRRTIILTGMAIVLALVFALSYHVILSHANSEIEDTSYKYFTSIQIEPGETLWELADQYADQEHYASREQYIAEVMAMNHLADEAISAGSYLILPYYSPNFVQ
ncbi:MAG: hypothetical protein NC543_08970 [bacterium]|nr:hypothetical protein [bacterium]MCM1375772.1 hypothetical protein [Muribaculum sp.]